VIYRSGTLFVDTQGAGFLRLGARLNGFLSGIGARAGLLNVFVAHTSASLCIQENADPDVLYDLQAKLEMLAPANGPYRHNSEGPDDMPAHIKTMLTATSCSIPVRDGKLALGTWQEVYLIEHRARPHRRRIEVDFAGF